MKMHFTYKNYRGETSEREVIVHHVRHISTDWHPEKQWIMTALDTQKGELRDFAMNDMTNVRPTPTLFMMTADVLRQIMGRMNEMGNLIVEVESGSPQATENAIAKIGEAKALLQSVLKGSEAEEPPAILPNAITPEIREVLRMPPWRVTTLADALRASGANISRRHEDATASVKFLLLHFVLAHGVGWHAVFRKYIDGNVSDGMKYLHSLPGYAGDEEPAVGDAGPENYAGYVFGEDEKPTDGK